MKVTIVQTGLANVASVSAAFDRLNCQVTMTDEPRVIEDAQALVLPGVGSFGAGVEGLRQRELLGPLKARAERREPLLAICLGLQLLCEASDESPGVEGMGVIPGSVEVFPEPLRRPQFGWNEITNEDTSVLGSGGYVYYANSYRLERCPTGWQSGWTRYGAPFVGCLQSGPVVACQFHPELSGAYGAQILDRWLKLAKEASC